MKRHAIKYFNSSLLLRIIEKVQPFARDTEVHYIACHVFHNPVPISVNILTNHKKLAYNTAIESDTVIHIFLLNF